MNILYTNFHTGYGGGHVTYIDNLISKAQFNAIVACPEGSQLYNLMINKKIPVIGLYFPSKFKDLFRILRSIIKLSSVIDNLNIDLIHTNENADNRIVFFASLLARKKIKIIFTKHNDKPIKKRFTSRWRFEYFNNAVIYVCSSIFNTIGVDPKKVEPIVIPNGVDTNYWSQEIKALHAPIHLVSIAGTSECKGIRYLLQALKILPSHLQKKLKVTIVGHYLSDHQLKNLGFDNSVRSIVNFENFTFNPRAYLLDADIGFVLSYKEETISFACREMMSAGLPVIVSNYGGLPNNVDHGINGWITNKADPNSIHDVLLEILAKNPDEILAFKYAARKKAISQFDLRVMIDKTYDIYKKLYNY